METPGISVWAEIWSGWIIGPFFIEGNLTGERYLDMLRNQILPAIGDVRVIGGNELRIPANVIFMQDGAPPHYLLVVRQFLNVAFPNSWIGQECPIAWPPCCLRSIRPA